MPRWHARNPEQDWPLRERLTRYDYPPLLYVDAAAKIRRDTDTFLREKVATRIS
jgi:hypothetical protein